MSYMFADSLRAGSGRNWTPYEQDQNETSSVLILLASFQQIIAVSIVKNT